jgi:hypothetical protein
VNPTSILKGLYSRWPSRRHEIRRDVEKEYNIKIGGGRCHFVDLRILETSESDGEKLAHEPHADDIEDYEKAGLIVPPEKCQYQESESSATSTSRPHGARAFRRCRSSVPVLLFDRDVALGVFLADARYAGKVCDQVPTRIMSWHA